jgi:hypothetical protein
LWRLIRQYGAASDNIGLVELSGYEINGIIEESYDGELELNALKILGEIDDPDRILLRDLYIDFAKLVAEGSFEMFVDLFEKIQLAARNEQELHDDRRRIVDAFLSGVQSAILDQ